MNEHEPPRWRTRSVTSDNGNELDPSAEKDEDARWLDALAGRPAPGLDPMEAAQAAAVRRALLARREAIEAEAAQLRPEDLERLRERLRKEGLLKPAGARKSWREWLVGLVGGAGPGGGTGRGGVSLALPLAGAVALLVLVLLVWRLGLPGGERAGVPEHVLRGDTATVLIVEDPQARLRELSAGLSQVQARFEVKPLAGGAVLIDIVADEAALAYLDTLRIVPTVREGRVQLVLRRAGKQP